MWGKCTDALAKGSQARFRLPTYQNLDHVIVLLGAIIIATGIITALMSASKKRSAKEHLLNSDKPSRQINPEEDQ